MNAPCCPDENLLVGYVSQAIEGDELANVEAHLADCELCSQLVHDLLRFGDDGAPRSQTLREVPASRKDAFVMATEHFGKYRLERVLGQGAMGTVYAARDEALDRRIALKILRQDASPDSAATQAFVAGSRARLVRESRAMAKLAHPNVVTVYDAGELSGRLYIAMELIDGVTLGGWLRAETRDWRDVLPLLLRAGDGLAAAHAAGLVHRDFKPENVLVGKSRAASESTSASGEVPTGPRVVVTDFGLVAATENVPPDFEAAAPSSNDPTLTLTRSGMMLGTPRYMSPEQFTAGKIDARSDQFSFGVVLYEVLYKRPPFRGGSLDDLKKSVCAAALETPSPSDVPPAMFALVSRALAREPGDRHASMADLLRELAPFVAPATPKPRARRTARIAAGAALLAGALALGLSTLAARSRTAHLDTDAGPLAPSPAFVAPTGPRAVLVLDTLTNESGEPRLTGTVETLLARDLRASLRLDAYTPAGLAPLAEELGATNEKLAPRDLAQRAADQGRAVWLVTGGTTTATTADGAPGVRLAITATNVASPSSAPVHAEAEASDARSIGAMARSAAEHLRAELHVADPPESHVPSRMSENLDALSAWSDGRGKAATRSWLAAIDAFGKAIAVDPTFTLARADQGFALSRDSRALEAATAYQTALAHAADLSERERLPSLGSLYGLQGNYTAATHAYQQYLALWPADLEAQTWVTMVMLDGHEYPLALDVAKAAVDEHPHAAAPHASYVSALFLSGDNAGAVKAADAFSAADRQHYTKALQRLLTAETFLDHDDAATALMHEEAAYDAELADEQAADLAYYRGHLSNAEAILRARIASLVAESDVTYARSENVMLAELLWQKGDPAGARNAADDALVDADKEATDVMLYHLGQLFFAAHAEREAGLVTKTLAARTDRYAAFFATLLDADRLRAHGETQRALERYGDALRLDDAWLAHERLGQMHLALGSWADAERELTTCIDRRAQGTADLEPGLHELPVVYFDLARAKEGAKKDDAADAYRAFLAIEHDADVDDPAAAVARKREASPSVANGEKLSPR